MFERDGVLADVLGDLENSLVALERHGLALAVAQLSSAMDCVRQHIEDCDVPNLCLIRTSAALQ